MKKIAAIFILVIAYTTGYAQKKLAGTAENKPGGEQPLPKRKKAELKNAVTDSSLYKRYRTAYEYFQERNNDSALYYADKAIEVAQKNNELLPTAFMLDSKAYQLTGTGNYANALRTLLQSFSICDRPESEVNSWLKFPYSDPHRTKLIVLSFTHHIYGILMERAQNTGQEILHFNISKQIGREIGFKPRIQFADVHLGPTYIELGKPDSALIFAREAMALALEERDYKYMGNILGCLGDVYFKKGNNPEAKKYYYQAIGSDAEHNNISDLTTNYLKLTDLYLDEGQRDSSLYFAQKTLKTLKSLGTVASHQVNIGIAYEKLYNSYNLRGQQDSAYKYVKLSLRAKDSVNKVRLRNLSEFQNLSLNEQLRLQDLKKEKLLYQSEVKMYAMVAGIAIFVVIAVILYRNNRHKQKANELLKDTLANLKSTQNQLIQSAKMASLGELTAGIAHEIQNPLNFVNNFSEVSKELMDELGDELDKGDTKEAKVISQDVIQNLEKIVHHGKRADAIVKGMLQHSQSGSAKKEPTNINALADEYLRLSYHGLRAKDKEFNAVMTTHYDPNRPMVNVIPQDIGRVLLNLFNNAFYAVNQKQKTVGGDYKPDVSVITSTENGHVVIKVKDNGIGIPDAIKEKIMQPFFTTKPTGEGTGLGLSLTYDMVVKGHGGTIEVTSNDGEGSEFTISLPIN